MSTSDGTLQIQRDMIFATVQKKFGFVPNLVRELAESPAVAQAYLSAADALANGSSLTAREQQAVQITVAAFNSCHYCTAVHGTLGMKGGLTKEDVSAILSGALPADGRLRLIVETTREILSRRGWLPQPDVTQLAERGLTRAQVFEIIAFVGIKTITNYINHIAQTPVDPPFSVTTDLPAYQESIVRPV